MSGAAPGGMTRDKVETTASRGRYDILIVDGAHKQSLTSARTLTKRGLRVAVAEADGQFQPGHVPPTFRSNACAHSMVLPDFVTDPDGYADGVVSFVRDNGVRVVLPVGDASIAVLAPHRGRLAELGCFLAVASDAALEIANDKTRTLEVAAKLDIDYPRSLPVAGPDDLLTAAAQFGYPYILKPTVSWTGVLAHRTVPVEVMSETEATEALERYYAAGCEVIAQQMATGDREGVSLFIVNGEVLAYCGCLAHRTTPPMGGVSAMRESIPVSPQMLNAAVQPGHHDRCGGPVGGRVPARRQRAAAADGDQRAAGGDAGERDALGRQLPADDLAMGQRPAGHPGNLLQDRRPDPVAGRGLALVVGQRAAARPAGQRFTGPRVVDVQLGILPHPALRLRRPPRYAARAGRGVGHGRDRQEAVG